MTELNGLWSQQDSWKVRSLKMFSVDFGVIISVVFSLVGLWSRTQPAAQPSVGWQLGPCHVAVTATHWNPPKERGEKSHCHCKCNSPRQTLWCLPNRCLEMERLIRQQVFSLLYLCRAHKSTHNSCRHPWLSMSTLLFLHLWTMCYLLKTLPPKPNSSLQGQTISAKCCGQDAMESPGDRGGQERITQHSDTSLVCCSLR